MNKYHYSKLIFLLITLLFSSINSMAQDEPVQLSNQNEQGYVVPIRTNAIQIKSSAPTYPRREVQNGREGMVMLSYIVDKNGEVQNAMVEDAFGNDRFVAASLRAVSRFVYEPATENGEAVSQSMTRMVFKYALDQGTFGASRLFIRDYREIMTLLASEEADKDSIYNLMLELKDARVNNLYEIAWYAWVEFNYLNKFEPTNRREIIKNLVAATMISSLQETNNVADSIYLSTDAFILASKTKFSMYIQNNELSQAMRVYDVFVNAEQLKDSDLYEGAFAFLTPLYEQIIEQIESDDTFVQTGNISSHGYWVQELLRPSFSIEAVNGTLKTVDLRCSGRNTQFGFIEDQVWTLPKSWGICYLYLEGEEGTSFEFYSIP